MTRRLNGVFTVLANADRVVPAPRSGALPGVGPRPIGVVPEGER